MVVDTEFSHEIATGKVEPLNIENNLSVIALVGESMKNHPGISGRMFSAMGRNGINIRAIAQGSSEKNISAVVSNIDVKKAINVLHEEFFETTYKQLNLFIVGTGNVGAKLIDQLMGQKDFLQKQYRLQIRVTGLSNSKKMLIAADGIDLENWREALQQGTVANLNGFVQQTISANLQNSIFVDVTANADVAGIYQDLLLKSVSVVACNKIAASSPYKVYKKLKDTASEYNCKFLFETNVGAALPIIGTLSDLIHSGDKILKIEAVLSGTLNFVFNNYDGSKKFGDVVKEAQDEGYTEPDPRLDLSGVDVMRKIMILARESGVALEMENIGNNSFMPEKCMQGSVEDFYKSMLDEEAHFKQLLAVATAAGCKLKFVAGFSHPNDGNPYASVGLQQIDPSHNLYHIYGKDNIVLFYTERYPENPLVVKGAGQGAEVTASGVFADIIRAGKV